MFGGSLHFWDGGDPRRRFAWKRPTNRADENSKIARDNSKRFLEAVRRGETPKPPFGLSEGLYSINRYEYELEEMEEMRRRQGAAFRRLPGFVREDWFTAANDCLALLQNAHLPDAVFYPVAPIIDDDGSVIEEPAAIVVPGVMKNTIDWTQSKHPIVVKIEGQNRPTSISYEAKDDDVVVSQQALLGADLWVEKFIKNTMFMSQRLYDAVAEAGLLEEFRPRRVLVK